MNKKTSLIEYLLKSFPDIDEKTLRSYIIQKKVLVNNCPVVKAGFKIDINADVRLRQEKRFLTRAGEKLVDALDSFALDVEDRVIIDTGCGMGGFTDILLKRGAALVYAVDVAYGQFDFQLRNHPQVVVMEKTNIRKIEKEDFDLLPDFAVLDISFSSIRNIVTKVFDIISGDSILVLIKPQFEDVSKISDFDGIVKSRDDHYYILTELVGYFVSKKISVIDMIPSIIKGRKGNQEFFALLSKQGENGSVDELIKKRLYG